jgi:hypothetical protein
MSVGGIVQRSSIQPTAGDPRERVRRRIVALVTVFYLLLIFEGALRKWVLTSYGQLLFFVRDPVVLVIYWLAFRYSFLPRGSQLLGAGVALGVLGLVLMFAQAAGVAGGIDKWPILAAYGWRNYFLYVPLPFIVAAVFEQADLRRIIKITFLLAVPIAFLVLEQFRSPLDAVINVGFGADPSQQFRGLAVDIDHTRPMGTFTSNVGQKEFVVSGIAMVLALWLSSPAQRFLRLWQILGATAALLTCLAVSGSRSAMLSAGLVVLVAIASAAVTGRSGSSSRAILVPTLIAVIAVVLYPIVFPEGYTTFANRWTEAQAAETRMFAAGIFGRGLYGFYEFFSIMGDAPVLGYGLGLAGNASLTLGVTIPGFNGWTEADWTRHIVDLGPIVGILYILYRIVLTIWLGRVCLAAARRGHGQLALLLFGSCALELLYGELTGHGTVNGYGWLFAGLALAAASAPRAETVTSSVALPLKVSERPFPNLLR